MYYLLIDFSRLERCPQLWLWDEFHGSFTDQVQGPMVYVIKKHFLRNIWRKHRFFTQITASFFQKFDHKVLRKTSFLII
jgi:hypothetical protein